MGNFGSKGGLRWLGPLKQDQGGSAFNPALRKPAPSRPLTAQRSGIDHLAWPALADAAPVESAEEDPKSS